LSIITPAIKAALMYKNRSIKQKKVVEKTQRRQGTKSMEQKTQPKTRLQLKRQKRKGFSGAREWVDRSGENKFIDQRQRPQKQQNLRMNAVGPDLEHTQPRIYVVWDGMGWYGMA